MSSDSCPQSSSLCIILGDFPTAGEGAGSKMQPRDAASHMTKADAVQASKYVAIVALVFLCLAIPKLLIWLIGSVLTGAALRWLLREPWPPTTHGGGWGTRLGE